MPPKFHVFEPCPSAGTTAMPDIVAFYPFQTNGNLDNSEDRLRKIAHEAGVTVMTGDLSGQSTQTVFDLAAKHALRPGNDFQTTSMRAADVLSNELSEYAQRIGVGHSLGGVLIAGVQTYGEVKPFDAIELADAFNLNAPQSATSGHLWYGGYLLTDVLQQKARKHNQHLQIGGETVIPVLAKSAEQTPTSSDRFERFMTFVKNVEGVSELMRSPLGRDLAVNLAEDPYLPLHVTGFTRGLSGFPWQLRKFMKELEEGRDQAAKKLSDDAAAAPIILRTTRRWHSDLVDHQFVANNLKLTKTLVA